MMTLLMLIRLQHFIELVSVWEEDDRIAGLGQPARQPHHPVPDESLAVLDVDTEVGGLVTAPGPGSGGRSRGGTGTWPGHLDRAVPG